MFVSKKQKLQARETVRKMLLYAAPPDYRRQQAARRPKLDAWTGVIDQILEEDKTRAQMRRVPPPPAPVTFVPGATPKGELLLRPPIGTVEISEPRLQLWRARHLLVRSGDTTKLIPPSRVPGSQRVGPAV